MAQTAHKPPPEAVVAEARKYLGLAEAAEAVARQWRARANAVLPTSQATLLRAVEDLAQDARTEATERTWGRRFESANIPAMLAAGCTPSGLSMREIADLLDATRRLYPSDIAKIAQARGLTMMPLNPSAPGKERRYRFIR